MEHMQAFEDFYDKLHRENQVPALSLHLDRLAITAAVHNNLLVKIERTVPSDFATVAELRDFLIATVEALRDETRTYTRGVLTIAHKPFNAQQEAARQEFLQFVRGLADEDLRQVVPLPYRRVLTDSKARRIAKGISQQWRFDATQSYWWPLREGYPEDLPADVLVLQLDYFYLDLGVDTLRDFLRARGITRPFQLEEHHWLPDYELDVELCHFSGSETIYSARPFDWLVYISHESSIAFAGAWLVAAVKQNWPDWERRIYTNYNYARPSDSIASH